MVVGVTFGRCVHSVVAFPTLGPLLQWVLVNYTVFGQSVDYLSQSALKIVGGRKKGSNESVVSLRYNLVLLQQTTYYRDISLHTTTYKCEYCTCAYVYIYNLN